MEEEGELVHPSDELLECARYGELEDAVAMLEAKADLNHVDYDGRTPLFLACANGHKDVVEMLLSKNAAVDVRNSAGSTALHWSALNGHTEVCQLLMSHGADPDLKNNQGRTPKNEATVKGNLETFMVLDKILDGPILDKEGMESTEDAEEEDEDTPEGDDKQAAQQEPERS